MGLEVSEVKPFGLAGSAGSTPLRITVEGDPPRQLFGKLYAQSHLRSDRWYKLGRELLYGRLEDEKPFNTVRRLVQQEDYALSLMQRAGLPSPTPYGFVELTPEREYLLVAEFFAGTVELGEAEVDDQVIDDGLGIIRKLWDAGLDRRARHSIMLARSTACRQGLGWISAKNTSIRYSLPSRTSRLAGLMSRWARLASQSLRTTPSPWSMMASSTSASPISLAPSMNSKTIRYSRSGVSWAIP